MLVMFPDGSYLFQEKKSLYNVYIMKLIPITNDQLPGAPFVFKASKV